MAKTEKQEDVIQEVATEEKPIEQQDPTEEKISYTEVKEDGTVKLDLSKLIKLYKKKSISKNELKVSQFQASIRDFSFEVKNSR